MFRSDQKSIRIVISLLTACLAWQAGCANLRLPAIDPYGRRIFLPRPAYTTLNSRDRLRDRQLFPNLPQPAFTRPESPIPPCNPDPQQPALACVRPRRPLLDCLLGPEQDDSCCVPYYQVDPCASEGRFTRLRLPAFSDDLPMAACSPVPDACYDPCSDPCVVVDPCYETGVILPAPPTSAPSVPATAPLPVASPMLPVLPRNRSAAYPIPQRTRGVYAARLQLDPQRSVAPVGSEVVLRAGLCGDDGYLIKKQPIEWSLSQDSVGNIVEVDEFGKPFWRRMLRKPPLKRSGDYAVGRTSTAPQVLTRGTIDPNDDIWMAEGQTWISITSASEGVSHVSAVAPSAAGWGERRQLATVHWIDGRWQFPPPAFAPAGSSREITTNVRRATTGDPIQNWIVRYEIVDSATADASGGQRTLEVRTDELGNASVNVTPLNNNPGVTQIRIHVIRVGNRVGDVDRVVVGEGTSSITWTASVGSDPYVPSVPTAPDQPADESPTLPAAPNLDISILGPPTVEPNGQATYQIDLVNRNAVAARNAELSVVLPRGMQLVSSQPLGNPSGDDIRWTLPEIPPQGTDRLRITLRATGAGPFRVCARARVEGVQAGQDCVDTIVRSPTVPATPPVTTPDIPPPADRLQVRMTGPETARVGDTVQFIVYVTNLGDVPLRRVMLRDDFDSGLGHSQGGSPIEWPISLNANETRELPLRFTATTPGQQCHRLTVTAEEGSRAIARACVNVGTGDGQPPADDTGIGPDPFVPAGQVEIDYRTLRDGVPVDTPFRVGQTVIIEFIVRNLGQTPLTNLQIVDQYNPILFPSRATGGRREDQPEQNRLVWSVDEIAPGKSSQVFQVEAVCEQPSNSACHTLSVIARGQTVRSGVACIQIQPASSPNTSLRPAGIHAPRVALSAPPPSQHTALTEQLTLEPALNAEIAPPVPHRDSGDPAKGNLRVTVSDLGDPARTDQRLTYVVMIRNIRDTADRNVVLTVTLPAGVRFETSINPPMIRPRNGTPDRRTIEFLPMAELRGGESATFRIVATSQQTGTGTFRAEVTSARSKLPVVATEETTFFVE